jgi:hypothetical protein
MPEISQKYKVKFTISEFFGTEAITLREEMEVGEGYTELMESFAKVYNNTRLFIDKRIKKRLDIKNG